MSDALDRKTFAVIGAGPKGIAVAVKAKVLEEFGFLVDRVILIEKNEVAANWSGEFGYTSGDMLLGTAPEKDLVFPLETDVGNDEINAKIRQRLLHFTWVSFLAHTNRYSDWVDRGRHAPCHILWALYLQWVAKQLTPEVLIMTAEVVEIDLTPDNKRWKLRLQESSHHEYVLEADRLMLTGPGKTRMDFMGEGHTSLPHAVYDLESFWEALKTKAFSTSGRLAIIGAGENAASALLALSQYAPDLRADVISPKGFISSRAESYYENQLYTRPEQYGWRNLTMSDRLEFIERTDSGVFSLHAMSILSDQIRHRIIPGRVMGLKQDEQSIALDIIYHQKIVTRFYDQVILATGFDQVSFFQSLLTPLAQQMIAKKLSAPFNQRVIASKIRSDLSVQGVKPYLHLPMLAGLMQGPGFANLSCLGSLSDRVVTYFAYRKMRNANQHVIPYFVEAVDEKAGSLC